MSTAFFGTVEFVALVTEFRPGKRCAGTEKKGKMIQQKISRIEYLLQEAKDLYYTVEKCHHMLERLEGSGNENEYKHEVAPLIAEHEEVLKELINEFEDYFELEKIEKMPVNLRYRRLYNEMKKDSTQQA